MLGPVRHDANMKRRRLRGEAAQREEGWTGLGSGPQGPAEGFFQTGGGVHTIGRMNVRVQKKRSLWELRASEAGIK